MVSHDVQGSPTEGVFFTYIMNAGWIEIWCCKINQRQIPKFSPSGSSTKARASRPAASRTWPRSLGGMRGPSGPKGGEAAAEGP
jgi:hypothetical protein